MGVAHDLVLGMAHVLTPPPLRGRVGVGGLAARTGGLLPLPPTPSLKGRGGVEIDTQPQPHP
jgi:hypothetical protein